MKNIIIRNSVRKYVKDLIPDLLNTALQWMVNKYPNVNFVNVDYIFSQSYNRSRYFRNEINDGKHINPTVCICTKPMLGLYDKKSLGIKKHWLYVGEDVQIICALIHELTHHIQYETNERKGNELDTTRNELIYLREYHPDIYNQITT